MKISYFSLWMCGIIFLVFLLQGFFPGLTELFMLSSPDAFERPWILLTSIFLHANIVHLLYNLFGLALFGTILEAKIGSKKTAMIFFGSGIIANIASVPFYNAALGASGAVFGIIGALAVLRPGMVVWVSYMPMPMFAAAAFWAIGDVFGLFFPGDVANAAHLAGLAAGLAAGAVIRRSSKPEKKEKASFDIPKSKWEQWEKEYMRK